MALFLKNAAASRANKPIPSAYYDGLPGAARNGKERPNPVIQKLEQEIGLYTGYMKKRAAPGYEKPADEAHSRPSDVLFELWNKYEPLLPQAYFHRRLLEMGDLLVSLQQYSLAERQCYSRYLDALGDFHVQLISDVDSFKKAFFPGGFQADEAGYTFRALMGRCICMFQAAKMEDAMLLNSATVQRCLQILSFLRLVTQVVLPTDSLCWLVYNGTVHIYSICRHLMAYGHSAIVLEYLLWASACMETSVPLLSVKYLSWRTTLYTAVCQCYYDCKAAAHAETFARRSLVKMNELSHLEMHSNAMHGPETAAVFRQATVKMAIMVFKRTAFESRKKPKGLLRPKVRANMKDYLNLPWPRTPTEKLLVDMFEGAAAQFLCILETLSDSNRRTLITAPPAPDNEVEMLDVYSELFFAAQEIICGGGGTHMYSTPVTVPNRATGLVTMPGVVSGKSLIELAANGQDGVPLSAVIKLVKLAFCYEQWDVYDAMANNVYNYIKELGSEAHLADQMALELMAAMEQLNSGRRRKHEMEAAEREKEKEKEREKQERRHAAAAAAASSDAAGTTPATLRAVDAQPADEHRGGGREAASEQDPDEPSQQPGGKQRKRAANRSRNVSGSNNNNGGDKAHHRSRATAASGGHNTGDAGSRDDGDARRGKDEHLKETSSSAMTALLAPVASTRSLVTIDELLMLAQSVQTIATTPCITPDGFDLDMVVDSVLFLWSKCKAVFQKYQTGSSDNVKYLRKMENPSKWVYVLEVVHQAVGWCGLSYVDPALTAEVTLRLALVMEASAAAKSASSARLASVTNDSERDIEDDTSQPNNNARYGGTAPSIGGDLDLQDHSSSVHYAASSAGGSTVLLRRTAREQLTAARDILELGLRNVSTARQVVALIDGGSTADIAWDKNLVKSVSSAAAASQLAGQAAVSSSQQQKHVSASEISLHASLSKVTEQPSALMLSSEARNVADDAARTQPMHQHRLLPETKPQYDTSVWVTVKDLHMEMYFMYFKVCMRLSQLGSVPTDTKKSHRSARSTVMSDSYKDGQSSAGQSLPRGLVTGNDPATLEQLLSLCGKNSLVKASLLIQQAAALPSQGQPGAAGEQLNLLEEAASLIGKAQVEERRLHADNYAQARLLPEAAAAANSDCVASDVPPAPILLSRSETSMVFRPAAFKPKSGEKVAWYRLFCRSASGSNVKVRLNDNTFQGCGNEVPAFNCQLQVVDLTPQERYVFAVAAYTADGRVVGGSIGETSRPILAALPLPVLLTWSYLAQVSYQVGQHAITRRAVHVLWEHFTATQPTDDSKLALTNMPTVGNDFKLTLPRLDKSAVEAASPVLLRAFLSSVFALVDVQSRELALYCDHLCDMPGSAAWAPAGTAQVARLRECEKLLVAVELSGWLNDAGAALQAAVTCYGLLAPLIYWRLPSTAAIQVLERCHIVLQEIPQGLRQRRTDKVNESLHHMVACVTYYLAKVLRSRGQKALANRLSEAGRKLLGPDDGKDKPADGGYAKDDRSENGGAVSADDAEEGDDGGMLTLAALKKKKGGKAAKSNNAKDEEMTTGNSELKALEAHLLRLSKQAQGEQELTGNEDPIILYAYIAFLPSRIAYKEVVKFKRRARYLEFLVQVVQKAIAEGLAPLAVEWCEETLSWIAKRNEAVVGSKAIISKQIGAVAIQGDDPKKFAAAVVEFARQKELLSPRTKGNTSAKQRRKAKFKLVALPTGLTPEERALREEQQIKAVERLALHLPDQFKQATRRRRFRKVCAEELPWRSQLNLVLGLSHFRTFLNKLEMREKVLGTRSSLVYSTSFLDPEWFTFETAGVLVVGLSDLAGGLQQPPGADERVYAEASQSQPRSRYVGSTGGGGKSKSKAGGKTDPEQAHRKNTGIERAAAASTGVVPPPLFPIPEQKRDSPRSGSPTGSPTEERKGSADMTIMSASIANDALAQTFNYFCRAVVLAHRGQHWAVMQNAVYTLWNCYHTALMRATTYEKQTRAAAGLLSQDMLRQTMLPSLYTTCDLWLDMLFFMESEQAKRAKREERSSGEASFSSNIEDEKGGLSLKFEPLLDDCTAVDMQFSRRLVGCTMEHLFVEHKWEKLIHVCLRFLALTGTRFVDQFVPMLVVAQRSLAEQLVQAGEFMPQPHMVEAQERCGGADITPRVYATQLKLLLPVVTDEKGVRRIVCHKSDGSAMIDPFAPSVRSDTALARKLSCVPVDFKSSLQLYQDSMSRATYNARALRHSRQLLVLYLGGLQQVAVSEALEPLLELQFNPHTAQPQSAVPADPRTRTFASASELQMVVMSRPQLEIVINSYEKTIEMLLAHNQKSLAAQAMHELGNLAYHSRNTRGAYKWWSDALDMLLNMADSVSSWHSALSKVSDIPKELLSRCGVWGCLLGGVLTSNISQYIMTSNLGLRTDCCYLSAYFFKAIFRASQPHPTADKDYASYDIGEGCDVAYLVPGIDFLSDRFRADGRGVLSALRWVTEELSRGRHHLFVLPLLTLYQYFASNVCRDLQRAVDSRILRVRVLTDLAFFKDATVTLLRLLHGERLPNLGDSAFRQVESRMPSLLLDTAKPLSDAANCKMMELLIDKRLSTNLSSFYGPHLTCQLTIAQAHLLIAIADTLPVVPTFDLREKLDSTRPVLASGQSRAAAAATGVAAPAPAVPVPVIGGVSSAAANADPQLLLQQQLASSAALVGPSSESLAMASNVAAGVLTPTESGPRSQSTQSKTKVVEMRFSNVNGEYSQEKCKGLLLDAAEMMLTTISDTLLDAATEDGGMENARPAELELWVQCQLNMAAVAQQRHHACMAVHTAFDALKMLMTSKVFQEKRAAPSDGERRKSSMKGGHIGGGAPMGAYGSVKLTDEQNNQFEFHNYQSRSRLDARLWLECKLALVKSMLGKNGGMGLIKGPITKVVVEMVDCRQYCAEGVAESEACNDAEMQAEFLMQAAFLNMTEGLSLQVTRAVVEDAIALLQKAPRLSTMGCLLHAQALILLSDIDCLLGSPQQRQQQLGSDRFVTAADSILEVVVGAHDRILAQMLLLGDRIRSDGASVQLADGRQLLTPVVPMPNVFLPHVPLLCQAKLRIAHLLACQTTLLDGLWGAGLAKDPAASTLDRPSTAPLMYRRALSVAAPALELCRAGARCNPSLLAELLLETGKLQRHLAAISISSNSSNGRQELDCAIITLLEAVQVSYSADHNLNFIRQGYLEVAMAYLSVSNQAYSSSKRASSAVETAAEADVTSAADQAASIDGTASPSGSSITQDGGKKKKKGAAVQPSLTREKTRLKKASDAEEEREKLAAMLAIRCAALTTQAQYNAFMMNGDTALTSQCMTLDEWQSMPQFAFLDLVGDYVIGQKKKLYKDWVEEQMAPLVESLHQESVPTYEEEVSCAQAEARDLSWVSLLGYRAILQRMCNHRTIAVKRPGSGDASRAADDADASDSSTMTAHITLAVHYPLCCGAWSLRVGYMHRFLVDKLAAYRERCIAPQPPAGLRPTPTAIGGAALALSQSRLLFSSSAATAVTAAAGGPSATFAVAMAAAAAEPAADQISSGGGISQLLLLPTAAGSLAGSGGGAAAAAAVAAAALGNSMSVGGRAKEKSGVQPPLPDNELCVQWYAPPYESPPAQQQQLAATGSAASSAAVYLLYAASKKDREVRSGGRTRYFTGLISVPIDQLSDLHERLVELVQKAEILLVDKGGKKGTAAPAAATAVSSSAQQQQTTSAAGASTKPKAAASMLSTRSKLKAQSPKLKKDEAIETLLRQSMVECYQIFGATLPAPQAAQPAAGSGGDSHALVEADATSQLSLEQPADESPKIPFEITIGNLKNLERLFNISYGNVVPSGKMFSWLFHAIPSEKVN